MYALFDPYIHLFENCLSDWVNYVKVYVHIHSLLLAVSYSWNSYKSTFLYL